MFLQHPTTQPVVSEGPNYFPELWQRTENLSYQQFLWGVSATRGAHLGSFFPVCKQPRQRGELETVNINPKAATQGCEEQNGHWESSMVADIPEDTWMEEQIQLAFTELVLD